MASREIRQLDNKWRAGASWPQWLEWIEITGIRGWTGQRVEFAFPIVALVGENGVGKSTVLQSVASVYRPRTGRSRFASGFFPDTPWERIESASIRWAVREGGTHLEGSLRKPTTRWLGNPDRRQRDVVYIDLSRIQPVSARVGYWRLAKPQHAEVGAQAFTGAEVQRLAEILGRPYEQARMALTNFDAKRRVPVMSLAGAAYSGFHQGAGEVTIAELIRANVPRYSVVLIDEIESSLHPRSQRRLIRDLAEVCRTQEIQLILTTHSPYVLEELPPDARLYVLESGGARTVIKGVSPEFAMTKMDEETHPECDLYVEDQRARVLLNEVLVAKAPDVVQRCLISAYGTASVGKALGIMDNERRFPRPTRVFLDGDQDTSVGCMLLPGGDAPEIVVLTSLRAAGWGGLARRVGRPHADVVDHCERAMLQGDHHQWVRAAANDLLLGSDTLWQAMCAEWATSLLVDADAQPLIDSIRDAIRA
jgi:predicted ATPase